ncbi:MAG TPA: PTS sugar transporter subunit IIA [Burkholderiales bacterium]|nr:PTS sugar transporter subunit IIA [Burkholderiales bacterium]
MYIQNLLSRQRVSIGVSAPTKERLFEQVGVLLHEGAADLDVDRASAALRAREQLGSTGIGGGVALPHGRVKGLTAAVGAFCTLRDTLDYDAIDQKPVNMVFALLVPEEASDEHLKILAELAGLFSNKVWRERLLAARTSEELYDRLTHPLSDNDSHDAQANRARPV